MHWGLEFKNGADPGCLDNPQMGQHRADRLRAGTNLARLPAHKEGKRRPIPQPSAHPFILQVEDQTGAGDGIGGVGQRKEPSLNVRSPWFGWALSLIIFGGDCSCLSLKGFARKGKRNSQTRKRYWRNVECRAC